MRLIDADELYDQYIDGMKKLISNTTIEDASAEALSLLLGAKLITDAPTVDAVEVVRCNECMHKQQCQKNVKYITRDPKSVTICYRSVDFCSCGERGGE